MKVTVFTLTQGGKEQGLRIKKSIPEAEVFTMPQFSIDDELVKPIENSLKDLVKVRFQEGGLLVFIMATGIVVRMIAPLLVHKGQDPAVVVMDENGSNIISLLSGHLGRANEWTLKLAGLLGANPVITTASDVKGLVAVDTFAMENNCKFTDWNLAKGITAHLVNGGEVGLYCQADVEGIPHNYHRVNSREEIAQYPYGVIISNKEYLSNNANILQLYPKNLVVGMGCKRGTPPDVISEELEGAFRELGLSTNSICCFATVDVKQEEAGLNLLAEKHGVPLKIINREDIKLVEKSFEMSSFVMETIGVGAVSGPCAYIASNGGKIILEKRRARGVTISVAEINEG